MSDQIRHALSAHDTHSPLTVGECLQLAKEMEQALIESECNFSHPEWRYVDGLRATALEMEYANARIKSPVTPNPS